MSTHPKLIGVKDQAHAEDLLMKYQSKIEWIARTILRVCDVIRETRKKRKLLARIRANVIAFNKTIPGQCTQNDSRTMLGQLPEVRKTALMLHMPSRTRFASLESVLEAFLRTRNIVAYIMGTPEFTKNLCHARSSQDRARRTKYRDKIESAEFFRQVRDLHNVMRLCRRYLRKFDSDEGPIYGVARETIAFQTKLQSIPLSEFMPAARRAEIMGVFMRRMTGSTPAGVNVSKNHVSRIKVSLLQDVHFSAFLLDPSLTPENDAPYLMRLHRHMCAYALAYSGGNEADFRREMLRQYKLIRDYWDNEELTSQRQMFQSDVSQFPLVR